MHTHTSPYKVTGEQPVNGNIFKEQLGSVNSLLPPAGREAQLHITSAVKGKLKRTTYVFVESSSVFWKHRATTK